MTTPTIDARLIVESALYQDLLRQRDEAMNIATEYREALVHIRARHYHDDHGRCVICGIPDCTCRDIADRALRPVPAPRTAP